MRVEWRNGSDDGGEAAVVGDRENEVAWCIVLGMFFLPHTGHARHSAHRGMVHGRVVMACRCASSSERPIVQSALRSAVRGEVRTVSEIATHPLAQGSR